MHRVAILAYDTVVAAELAMFAQVFATANLQFEEPVYAIGVVGADAAVTTSPVHGPALTLVPDRPLSWAADADTVVIPAHGCFLDPPPPWVRDALLAAHARRARVASLCVGAFILASTGLLDGRPSTTHWDWADELAARFPAVLVQREKLFVGQDGVHTGAGVTASLDLALHLLEQDHGAGLGAAAARHMVAPMRREGGQAQFIEYHAPRRTEALQDTLRWAEEHLADDLTVADLARHAHMSPRTFTRRFRAGTGATPMDWLLRTRIRRAKELLENTSWPIDRIARECGFRAPSTFRHHFGRVTAVTPARYRRTFGA
jgi:transcriptional regulator GlxA family with amidase domain